MSTIATRLPLEAPHPVQVRVEPALEGRDRLSVAFRIVLAIPHLLLVGAPLGAAMLWPTGSEQGAPMEWAGSGGVLGTVAVLVAVMAWFAILIDGRYPDGLWRLAAYYLRWRVHAVAYTALLRDEYPPFGVGPYPVALEIFPPERARDRLSVAFRLILALPHLVAVWALGMAWGLTTLVAWFAIVLTGRYPAGLYDFGVGVLRWNARVEAYLLLLRDEYPPFSLDAEAA